MIVFMDTQTNLLSAVEAFLKAQKMSATKFGLMAVNDGKLVPRLRAGANMTFNTSKRVLACIEQNRAPGAA